MAREDCNTGIRHEGDRRDKRREKDERAG
jgi:hypothetical protein